MRPRPLQRDDKSFVPVLYMAMELSHRNWKLLFGDGARRCQLSIAGGARSMMVEIAWLWLRYQPDSELSQCYQARFAGGGKRMRRVSIVAIPRGRRVARRCAVDPGDGVIDLSKSVDYRLVGAPVNFLGQVDRTDRRDRWGVSFEIGSACPRLARAVRVTWVVLIKI